MNFSLSSYFIGLLTGLFILAAWIHSGELAVILLFFGGVIFIISLVVENEL